MSLAFWCLLLAAAVPYGFVSYAKASRSYVSGRHNKAPREYAATLTGRKQRAYWAQLNGFETFPPFLAAVLVATLSGAPALVTDSLAAIFVVLRIAYGVFYIADRDKLRSLAWVLSMACIVALFVAAATAGGS